jgi:LDH2 family malate/lactate/ureidoglycolate dehydrogenase
LKPLLLTVVQGSTLGESPPYSLTEIHRFIKECMQAIGTPVSHAEALATCLTEADYRGHYCEGLNQLGEILFEKKLSKKHVLAETYIDEIREGGCNKDAVPHILKETPVTAWVDGNNGLGVVVGNFCMNLAIKKAKASGIGWVVAKGEDKISSSC